MPGFSIRPESIETPRLLALDPDDGKAQALGLGKGEITVGSDEGNNLTIVGGGVSRRHAVIRHCEGRYELRELNSTNGTFVNNRRIASSTRLKDGDEIRFGSARFKFLDRKEASAVRLEQKPIPGWLGLRTAVELLGILFLIGFAFTEYLINRDYIDTRLGKLTGPTGSSATSIVATPAPMVTTMATTPAVRSKGAPEMSQAGAPVAASALMASAVAPPRDWLARVNYYRALAKLPPVVEDPTLSGGDFNHARYLVENYANLIRSGGQLGAAMHSEEQTNSWYSPKGIAAARKSDVYEGCGSSSPAKQVDGWMTGPFHRLSILNPNLGAVGYGHYENDGCWGAALDLHLRRPASEGEERVVMFPPDGATISLRDFDGREWPHPLPSCAGYVPPVGLPITLQMGRHRPISLDGHSISIMGRTVEHCGFDFATYRNANESEQKLASQILQEYGAIVLIPREPLTVATSYRVSITAGGNSYTWSFKIAGD